MACHAVTHSSCRHCCCCCHFIELLSTPLLCCTPHNTVSQNTVYSHNHTIEVRSLTGLLSRSRLAGDDLLSRVSRCSRSSSWRSRFGVLLLASSTLSGVYSGMSLISLREHRYSPSSTMAAKAVAWWLLWSAAACGHSASISIGFRVQRHRCALRLLQIWGTDTSCSTDSVYSMVALKMLEYNVVL
jgi:hypothetical protein